ncbi:MAG: DNA polymerase thumb domain-containing protein [Lachnospiraceae bacterium]
MEQTPLIFHIDVNSAFLSWESVYRIKQDPDALDLRTIPSAVGGDASKRHGIVLAKSTPAKKYGIVTGEPLAQAFKKCPELVVVPSRFEVYIDYSSRLLHLLEDYTPDIEKFSIDEAFLDMTQTIHLFGDTVETANRIRQRVSDELGFTVNVGIAPNTLLAKMASDFQKPDRTHTLFLSEIQEKMWPLPVRELFFVGQSAQKKMARIGIRTIGDLANYDVALLRTHLGNKYGTLIHQYANGIDPSPVANQEPQTKGYGNSITLSRDVSDYDTACQVLLSLCETVGARLRADHVTCNCVCVELKDWEFHTQSHQTTLPASTDSTQMIYEQSCRLLKEFWDLTPVRLIGVRTSKIADDSYRQISLFDTPASQKQLELEKAVDKIRDKFGVDSIKRASFLKKDAPVDHAAGKAKHLNDRKSLNQRR